jgi:hypothetical protein
MIIDLVKYLTVVLSKVLLLIYLGVDVIFLEELIESDNDKHLSPWEQQGRLSKCYSVFLIHATLSLGLRIISISSYIAKYW